MTSTESDLVVIGAGAAGLATAIFAARAAPAARVVCLDGARHIGAKILVSGGSRCNVTNRVVSERDFWGGSSALVRRVLRAFPEVSARRFFEDLGVALHEEEDGKLFPDTNTSRTVLHALLGEASRLGVVIRTSARVTAIVREETGFAIETRDGRVSAQYVALATGGRSLPKTGSDGGGYELAGRLGHGYVETTPALAPLLVDAGASALDGRLLAGVSHPVELTLLVGGRIERRLNGAMLWTHVGVSGPVALNMSRHWHHAVMTDDRVSVAVSLCPDETVETMDAWLLDQQRARPRAQVNTVLAQRLPAALAHACVSAARVAPGTTMAHLTRNDRRQLIRTLIDCPLPVTGSRGYAYAEVTAGGIPLDEIDPATMQSRVCPSLFLVGEILDVDGRLGGFNFQWAWSSGFVAGNAVARAFNA